MRPLGSNEKILAHNRRFVFGITAGALLATVLACGRPSREPEAAQTAPDQPTIEAPVPTTTRPTLPTPTADSSATLIDESPVPRAYIDTHTHLAGIYNSDGVVVQDYETATENLITLMDQQGVARALVMPPPQFPGQPGAYDYHNLLGAVQQYPDRLSLVAGGGTLNPLIIGTDASEVTDEIRDQFEAQAEELIAAGAVAFGEMTALHLCMTERHHFIAAPPDHPLFLLLADIAARHNVPVDFHMEAVPEEISTRAGLREVCSKNPGTIY